VKRRTRILLAVADELRATALRAHLGSVGHEVRVRGTAMRPVEGLVVTFRPDLVILEALDGEMSSIALTIRRLRSSSPALILCAVDRGANERTAALEAGADAYIERPFTAAQLELHVRALLRRSTSLASRVHHVGELVIDEDAHVVAVADQTVSLPAKEFKLLTQLASHPGVIRSKRQLLEAVWGYEAYDENLVEVHMSGLRRHLPPEGRRLIRTVRGLGYVLREDLPLHRLA